jgi:glycerol-3-phosphate O-acyltransferase
MAFKDDMEKIVLSYPKLKEKIESRANPKEETQKAIKNLNEIKADFSKTYINSFQKLLDASLPKLYDGINFDENEVDFRQLVKDSSVVLVPNHQSHADYVAINYMVYKKYGFPLYVAGGNNLNIFPIGTLFRKSGCFFIRRSFGADILYKLTLEAYLFYLLYKQKPIEFFFEGGRSRTGKLLPPRYGLYQMLLEAHSFLPVDVKKDLKFVPVSIAHEYVPEQKALTKELGGSKKRKESAGQVFGLVKLFARQFGSVHINLGKPVTAAKSDDKDLKEDVQKLAFDCFRRVGKNMVVTPSSLMALILLDEASGALKWVDIYAKAKAIIKFCDTYGIPFTTSLKLEKLETTLGRALDILIGNNKVEVIGRSSRGHTFYSIKEDSRLEILYFKNSILHHFLIACSINSAWINLFNGKITSVHDLKEHFMKQRKQLKHEFYLPTVKEYFTNSLKMISDAIGRELTSLNECMELSHKELYSIASYLGVFSRSMSYIHEAYFVCAITIKQLSDASTDGFKMDEYSKSFKENFDQEKAVARVIRFTESSSTPLMKNAMKYFMQEGMVVNESGSYKVSNAQELEKFIKNIEEELVEQLKFNLRVE